MTKKSLQKKIKHHYVWSNYLKRWSPNDRDVFYTTKKGKISFDSVKGIARENDFYRVNPLTEEHIEVIRQFSRNSSVYMQKHHNLCLDRFLKFQNSSLKNIEAREVFECNGLEDLHTFNEGEAQMVMQFLAKRDLGILDSDENMAKFCIYLGHQHTRTKTFRENVLCQTAALIGRDNPLIGKLISECSWFLSYIFGMNFGASLFNTREKDKHCLLLNDTELPFVTSDQPVLNVFGPMGRVNVLPPSDEELELYYPISPQVGYMINTTNRFQQGKNVVSVDTVAELNMKVSRKADTFLVSSTHKSLVSLVRHRATHTKNYWKQHGM